MGHNKLLLILTYIVVFLIEIDKDRNSCILGQGSVFDPSYDADVLTL